jgi:small subunit ribosomal protein S1
MNFEIDIKQLQKQIDDFKKESAQLGRVINPLLDNFKLNKQEILEKLEIGKIITGEVQRLTPFGAFVDIGGIDGLVHISEMAWSRVEHPSDVVSEGDEIKVKVLKVDRENERISLSIKETLDGPWESIEGKISDGDIITGTVKRLVNFGAFVEIADGVEGLVHISQISHHHINTPQEVLEEGQEIKVKVLELSIADKRASLSIKETLEEPEYQKSENNNSFDRDSQGLNFTLGERFGDKLDQFKK